MPRTYETPRGVYFDPREVRLGTCLKCAAPTTRRSPRAIAVRDDTGVVQTRGLLSLCEICDARWRRARWIGRASFAMPLVLPVGVVLFDRAVHRLPGALPGIAFFLGLVAMLVMGMYAAASSVRVRALDGDGLVGLDNIHPDVRADIVARGAPIHAHLLEINSRDR